MFTVIRRADERELSCAVTYKGATLAARTHLLVDGEEGPLEIVDPSGLRVAHAEIDNCGNFVVWGSSLTDGWDKREQVLLAKWGRREVAA